MSSPGEREGGGTPHHSDVAKRGTGGGNSIGKVQAGSSGSAVCARKKRAPGGGALANVSPPGYRSARLTSAMAAPNCVGSICCPISTLPSRSKSSSCSGGRGSVTGGQHSNRQCTGSCCYTLLRLSAYCPHPKDHCYQIAAQHSIAMLRAITTSPPPHTHTPHRPHLLRRAQLERRVHDRRHGDRGARDIVVVVDVREDRHHHLRRRQGAVR